MGIRKTGTTDRRPIVTVMYGGPYHGRQIVCTSQNEVNFPIGTCALEEDDEVCDSIQLIWAKYELIMFEILWPASVWTYYLYAYDGIMGDEQQVLGIFDNLHLGELHVHRRLRPANPIDMLVPGATGRNMREVSLN